MVNVLYESAEIDDSDGVLESDLIYWTAATVELVPDAPSSITIIITDDAFIRKLNSEYRSKDYPTDVLSFPADDNDQSGLEFECEESCVPGEVYISIDTARRQAVEFGVTVRDEVKRLLIHGLLHLSGYDHERSAEDERIMSGMEDLILSKI